MRVFAHEVTSRPVLCIFLYAGRASDGQTHRIRDIHLVTQASRKKHNEQAVQIYSGQ